MSYIGRVFRALSLQVNFYAIPWPFKLARLAQEGNSSSVDEKRTLLVCVHTNSEALGIPLMTGMKTWQHLLDILMKVTAQSSYLRGALAYGYVSPHRLE